MSFTRIQESAALLLTWSVWALVEGTIRMTFFSKPPIPGDDPNDIDYWTDSDADGNRIVPIGALLTAGVAEVLFGVLGCYLAFYSLVLNKNNANVTFMFLILQAILGWFVFLTFVIAEPAVDAAEDRRIAARATLSTKQNRTLIILGNMLGSICFCWALQGGQFIFIMRLWHAQKGDADSKSKNAMRGIVWSGNMIAAAFSTLFVGSQLQSLGFSSDTGPMPFPPHVVWRPWLSIVTGVIMFIYGVVGILASKDLAFAQFLPHLFVATTTAMLINFSWTFGIVPGLGRPIPGAAQHTGLVFAMTFLPMFHARRAHVSIEDSSSNCENGNGNGNANGDTKEPAYDPEQEVEHGS